MRRITFSLIVASFLVFHATVGDGAERRREPSDPSAALANVQSGFRGGATGAIEALEAQRAFNRQQELLRYQYELEAQLAERQAALAHQQQPQASTGLEHLTDEEIEANLVTALIKAGRYRLAGEHERADIIVQNIRLKRTE